MVTQMQERRDRGFGIGLLVGTCMGAGLMLWLAPRMITELRQRVADSVDDLAQKGQRIRDDAADAVARSAREVERLAVAARTPVARSTRA